MNRDKDFDKLLLVLWIFMLIIGIPIVYINITNAAWETGSESPYPANIPSISDTGMDVAPSTTATAQSHDRQSRILIELSTKLGTSADTPTSGQYLKGMTTDDSSSWVDIPDIQVPMTDLYPIPGDSVSVDRFHTVADKGYIKLSSTQPTGQSYQIAYEQIVPDDFTAWDNQALILDVMSSNDSSVDIGLYVEDSSGTVDYSLTLTLADDDTWKTIYVNGVDLDSPYTPTSFFEWKIAVTGIHSGGEAGVRRARWSYR